MTRNWGNEESWASLPNNSQPGKDPWIEFKYLSQGIVNYVWDKSFIDMNAAEIKLDLFRRIDSLKEDDLEKVYNEFIALLSTTSPYKLSKAEKAAINEALEASKDGQFYTREEVIREARKKYPDLDFR